MLERYLFGYTDDSQEVEEIDWNRRKVNNYDREETL